MHKISTKVFDRSFLLECFSDSILSESIFIASPDLFSEITKWIKGCTAVKKEEEKLIFSLIKYLSRMECRPTPFGLFAGCGVGKISKDTEVRLSHINNFTRHTRLDMNYLCALSKDLSRKIEIRRKLHYFPNNSLYQIGDKYRYVEYHYEKSKRIHHTVSIEKSSQIESILIKCRNGASYLEIVNCIKCEDISFEDATHFLDDLIENQIIVSELEPSTTGPEQLYYILHILEIILGPSTITIDLSNISTLINTIDNNGIGNCFNSYEEIINIINKIGTNYDKKYLFQTDLVLKTTRNNLSRKIPEDVKKGVTFLNKLGINQDPVNLIKFREAFFERYEEREIPLSVALDTELGIGYATNDAYSGDLNPLIDDLRVVKKPNVSGFDIKWNLLQSFLLKKYRNAIQSNLSEVNITDEEIDGVLNNSTDTLKLGNTFSALIEVVEADTKNDIYKILLKNVGGSTGAHLLGRFCHGDIEMLQLVNETISIENELAGDTILAEIVHLPESRTGNVLLRPVIRNFEIPYLARGSVEKDFQISIDDLFISLKSNQIVLRSKKLNKVIIPRLTNAHNFSFNALPVYQFLCDLQFQGNVGGLAFSWGSLANEHPFLPRVNYNNLILSPAQWHIIISDVKKLFEVNDDVKMSEAIYFWRKENKIPKQVMLADGDNDLFIDLENPLYLKMLWAIVKNRQFFKLEEFLYNPRKPLVTSPNGWHTNEIILIFRNVN